ncbi:MAG: hypothetical protein WCC86_06500 [Methanoregula sp.]
MNYFSEETAGSKVLAFLNREKIIGFILIGSLSSIIDIGLLD